LFSAFVFGQESETSATMPDPGRLIEPDPVRFSFDAPGWYVLAVILIISFVIFFIRWMKRYRKNAYRRAALRRIAELTSASTASTEIILNELMILLKRVALQTYGRQKVASLSGEEWFSYLESKGKNTPFVEFEEPVTAAIYEGEKLENKTIDELVQLSKKWIKTHA
jgi:hypothetical protein